MPKKLHPLSALSGVLALAAMIGCANPQGEYENFITRYETINPQSSSSSGAGGGCVAPIGGEADGDFLFALSANISPKQPLVFLTSVTTTDGANGLDISMSLQPLAAADRMTAVGAPIVFDVTAEADGTFMTPPANIAVDGAANPLTGTDITAEDVSLAGIMCASMPDTVCGAVDGNITAPIMNMLSPGSAFSMQRVTSPADYPEPPPYNCAGALADPL